MLHDGAHPFGEQERGRPPPQREDNAAIEPRPIVEEEVFTHVGVHAEVPVFTVGDS